MSTLPPLELFPPRVFSEICHMLIFTAIIKHKIIPSKRERKQGHVRLNKLLKVTESRLESMGPAIRLLFM